jgi:signal transduction histidine kinase
MAINLLAAEELARDLRAARDGVPLLAFRLPVLERTAWRAGLRAARALERRARAAFAHATGRVLRAADLVAHDRGSDVFLAALAATPRDGAPAPAPVDVRSAQARIAGVLDGLGGFDVDAGWTRYAPGDTIDAAVERAIARGAVERERYAFFSAVGHELRTPLTAIRGSLETLATEPMTAAARRRFVATAHAEALRLSRLVDAMFELSLLDVAATFPLRGWGALDVACHAAVSACTAAAAARGVAIVVPPIPPAMLAVDGERLTLVLINLIDNAIKHGRAGGRIALGVALDHPRAVTLAVDDDGPGIPPADRERLFAFGARGATSARGTGIGLAFVRMTMERIGGRVEAGDAPGGGARFTLTLPRR